MRHGGPAMRHGGPAMRHGGPAMRHGGPAPRRGGTDTVRVANSLLPGLLPRPLSVSILCVHLCLIAVVREQSGRDHGWATDRLPSASAHRPR